MVYTDKMHLLADTLEELHEFALKIGLKRSWFQSCDPLAKYHVRYPHYDIFGRMVSRALRAGALVADRNTIVEKMEELRLQEIKQIGMVT